MARLSAATRGKMPKGKFAGPGKSFPINDPEHARLAIGGATRSERAGNISASTAASIKAKARAELGDSGPGKAASAPNPGPPSPAGKPATPPQRSPAGATDGLGRGRGGLAVHSSLAGHNIDGYEPQHSSRTR